MNSRAIFFIDKIVEENRKVFLILAAACLILFINTLGNEFVFDDSLVITDAVKEGLSSTVHIFTSHEANSTDPMRLTYRPIRQLSLAFDYQFFNGNITWMHFHNVLWMIAFVWISFKTISRLFPEKKLPILLGLLFFITLPIHSEVVANIKSRDELISATLGMFATYLWVKYIELKNWRHLATAVIVLFIALLAKIDALAYILIWFLIAYYRLNLSIKKKFATGFLSLLGVTILFSGNRALQIMLVGKNKKKASSDIDIISNVLNGCDSYIQCIPTKLWLLNKYLYNLIWPNNLTYYNGYNQIPLLTYSDYQFYIALFVWIIMISSAAYFVYKKSWMGFAMAFFIVHYMPISQFVKLGPDTMADRFVFNASLGYSIAIVVLITTMAKALTSVNKYLNIIFLIFMGSIIGYYSYKTIERNAIWKNDLTLFGGDMPKLENCMKANFYYANTLFQKSKSENNIQENKVQIYYHFIKAINLMPQMALNYCILSDALMAAGEPDRALQTIEKGIENNDKAASLHFYKARILYTNGNYDLALDAFLKLLEMDSNSSEVYRHIIGCYNKKLDKNNALFYINEGLKKFPQKDDFYIDMAKYLANEKDYHNSILWAEKAIANVPNSIEAHHLLTQLYALLGNKEKTEYYQLKMSSIVKK